MADKIGYVVHTFPRLTLTFVLREILALEQLGAEIVVFSLKEPYDTVTHPEFQQMSAPIVYLPEERWSLKNIAASLFRLCRFFKYPHRLFGIISFLIKNLDKKLWGDFLAASWLTSQLDALGVRHLHAHAATSETAIAMFAAILTGKTFSFTAHASDIFPRQDYLPKKLDTASFVVAISEYNRRFLMSIYGNETIGRKIHVVHCGVPLALVDNTKHHLQQSPAKKFTILTVARLVEQKGHHILIEALSILRKRGHEFCWIVVGSGPRQAVLKEMIKVNGLSAYVDFKEDQDSDTIFNLLQTADVFVLPCIRTKKNLMDGIPVALMEAMSAGTPVVSTFISGIPELVEDGISGFLVHPNNPAALADSLDRIMRNPILLEQVRNPAQIKVKESFVAEVNASKLYQLFLNQLHGN
ncbi:MAG: glycosyltransferase family 4 protein [Anaerolineae bacterium]|nr:glycosyltransferase family 4 protein [Anaerolineae bacterium]